MNSGKIWIVAAVLGQMATVSASSSLRKNAHDTNTNSVSAATSYHQGRNLNSFNYSSLRVDEMYTYGAPSIANPQMSNPGNKCIPGLRMYTEDIDSDYCDWWDFSCTPREEITNTDFAAHWNAEDLPHPKMSTLALIWRDESDVEYLFWECKDEDGVDEYDFQWWPHYSNSASIIFNIHSITWDYEGRLLNVPESVRGPSLEYASIASCAYETSSNDVTDCLVNYSGGGNGIPGIDTSVWSVAAFMNHQSGNGDNDPVAVYENTQTVDSYGNILKKCIISFAGSDSLTGDMANFLFLNSGTTGYCGRDGVHIGVRNELWRLSHDEQWATIIKPQLETCHELTCVGHSLGGSLCNAFTMCANQGEENLDDGDDEGMWDDFNALVWTKPPLPSGSKAPTSSPTSASPTGSPIPRPTGVPSAPPSSSPTQNPTAQPTSMPTPGRSPTKIFTNTNRNAKEKAKGIMFQMEANLGRVVIEKMSFKTKDNKQTEVQVYFRLGPYSTFPSGGLNKDAWGDAIYDGIPSPTSGGLMEVVFENVTIPTGVMASFYLAGKKEFMFEEGEDEFALADEGADFNVYTGSAMKKPFQQVLNSANFIGVLTYYTYTELSDPTPPPTAQPSSAPTAQPSSSPTRFVRTRTHTPTTDSPSPSPTRAPSSSPTKSPTQAPTSATPTQKPTSPIGANDDDTPKVYTTIDVDDAEENTKGIMFTLTTKTKEVTITGLGLLGKDNKESDVKIYYLDRTYKDFDAFNKNNWAECYNDGVVLVKNEITDIELMTPITIPAGGTGSLYVLSKKGLLYSEAGNLEFRKYEESEDFELNVGMTTKKDFQQFQNLAEFAGRFMYEV